MSIETDRRFLLTTTDFKKETLGDLIIAEIKQIN